MGDRATTLAEMVKGVKFSPTQSRMADIHQGFQHLEHTLNQPHEQLQLSMGNAMIHREQLEVLASFPDDAHTLYMAQVVPTKFEQLAAAEQLINDFVRNETHGKIVDLISNLDQDTALILVNYIFLKAKWETPFDPEDTVQSKFYMSKGQTHGSSWGSGQSFSGAVMEKSFVRSPKQAQGEVGGDLNVKVTELEAAEGAGEEGGQGKGGPKDPQSLRTAAPQQPSVRHPLDTVKSKFYLSEGQCVQVPMVKFEDLTVSYLRDKALSCTVVHRALLDVAEKGTETAAATGVKAAFSDEIYDTNSDTILFLAKVANPSYPALHSPKDLRLWLQVWGHSNLFL
ncbi:alpha-1-antichymotrypsin-like [Perognathus longimembris pacificus]|uniref:alpha-1-antichymotrypsin-like n=1 Tax=Perognathus longimembris pacificus TaxID=214514 RepID=UPI002018F3F0|nr:alpha-1-antichymotrypsin-like [Perognathus longimembris pacificus]